MRFAKFLLLTAMCTCYLIAGAQETILQGGSTRKATTIQRDAQGRPIGNATTGKDSLQRRDELADSITITFRYFDSTSQARLDSSILNIHTFIPQPYNYLYLGNLGAAARPILFTPRMYAGFDPGFHAYDIYQLKLSDTRFYQTTRPYTEMSYGIGPRQEQTINVLFTQNFKPTYNFSFEYRFVDAPGTLKNLKDRDRGIRIAVPFTTKARRYSGNAVLISNKMSAGESGGIVDPEELKDSRNSNRYLVRTRIGGDPDPTVNVFGSNTNVTGMSYTSTQFYFRHQYDLGQTDSLQTDSGYVKLFYPRFRVQHNLSLSKSSYQFRDAVSVDSLRKYFGYSSLTSPVLFKDSWSEIKNELALIVFPEKNNQNQFLKVGAAHQLLNGTLGDATLKLYNIYLFGEYRNRTRNKRWDINASGQLYTVGFNAGDYMADIRTQVQIGKRFGSAELGFQNSNRTPGFVYDNRSSFPLLPGSLDLKKENITHLYGSVIERGLGVNLSAHYYLLANYTYFDGYFHATQEATIINVLRLSATKKFNITKHWHLYSELSFQQPTAEAIHLPAAFTHHQLAYEGNFFKNLDLSTGIEVRYFTPFKADTYSPLTGQFVWQDTTTISNRPDLAAFLHMRIKNFKLFIRVENLNTISFQNGFGFTHNNYAAPNYITPGQFIRFGFRWTFIN